LLVLKRFNKRKNLCNDQKVLAVLKDSKTPLSLELISLLTGIRKDKLCYVLKSLERYGLARKKYKKLMSFWVVSDD
jgi:DNA-binding transcriptional regulator GbsR (MarR family)